MNGKVYEMEVELIEESKPAVNIPVTVASSTKPIVDENIINDPNVVTTPMPGNVIQILKAEGDPVKKGESVLILEAMKMENEIYAHMDGTIRKIFVSEGQSAGSEAPLFEIKPEE